MSTSTRSRIDPSSNTPVSSPSRQVGPWDPQQTLQITLVSQGTELIRFVATGDDPTPRTRYGQMMEYWRTSSLSPLTNLRQGDTLDLRVASSPCSDQDIDTFFGTFQAINGWSEAPPEWSSGCYGLSTLSTVYFFSIPDLDAGAQGRRLGLSLVVANGELVGVGWHKSFNPGTDYAWTPPALGPIKRYLTFVGSTPSALEIPGGNSWWYVLQP